MDDVENALDQLRVTQDVSPSGTALSFIATETHSPPTAVDFAKKAKDLDALRSAVVDAAGVGGGLWFSYLFTVFYLAIAVGGVTHRDLLFERPVKLPFLNVDLPLKGFFVLGPSLFLIMHAYVLIHIALLAGKVGAFHDELHKQIADEDVRTRLRRQLPINIFVQFLAGPQEVRKGILRFMLRLIADISLVFGPVALLVFFQLQFLPYHDELIAWWQRMYVVADLALLWLMWPTISNGETRWLGWRDMRRPGAIAALVASLIPFLLVFAIATFPGEWLERTLQPKDRSAYWQSLRHVLVAGDVEFVARKTTSLWSNRLVLPDIDLVSRANFGTEAKTTTIPETLSLRGRRLEGAVLLGSQLRNVDFTGAQLQGAALDFADLQQANFGCDDSKLRPRIGSTKEPQVRVSSQIRCANLQNATLSGSDLRAASLSGSDLQSATLNGADLRGATLSNADLRGAVLDSADLQTATLDGAHLQGASLVEANLQGVNLYGAEMQGTNLNRVHLQGATLNSAHLEGASLIGADLRVATLDFAHLMVASLDRSDMRGASLFHARLHGATLVGTQLQGVSLSAAELRDATLSHVLTWRTDVRPAITGNARVVAPISGPIDGFTCGRKSPCVWSDKSFVTLRTMIAEQLIFRNDDDRARALKRIAVLDPEAPLRDEQIMANAWNALTREPQNTENYRKRLAAQWREAACDPRGAPFVIRHLLPNLIAIFGEGSPEIKELAETFLSRPRCAAALTLTDEDREKLRNLRDQDWPAADAPSTQPKE